MKKWRSLVQLRDVTKGYASFAHIYCEMKLDVPYQYEMIKPGNFNNEFLFRFAIRS